MERPIGGTCQRRALRLGGLPDRRRGRSRLDHAAGRPNCLATLPRGGRSACRPGGHRAAGWRGLPAAILGGLAGFPIGDAADRVSTKAHRPPSLDHSARPAVGALRALAHSRLAHAPRSAGELSPFASLRPRPPRFRRSLAGGRLDPAGWRGDVGAWRPFGDPSGRDQRASFPGDPRASTVRPSTIRPGGLSTVRPHGATGRPRDGLRVCRPGGYGAAVQQGLPAGFLGA
jgi:hypothetical protein